MKSSFPNSKWFISAFIVLLALGFFPFLFVFSGSEISKSITDWGSFGSYLSGIIGGLNIVVFIYISYLVSESDEKRNQKQIKAQTKIALSQFRQSELDKLSQILDSALFLEGKDAEEVLLKISSVYVYLKNFRDREKYLFPIIDDPEVKEAIDALYYGYDHITSIAIEIESNNKTIGPKDEQRLNAITLLVHTQTSFIVEKLRKFILDDLNN